jgi:very-short-patch-repair endonuclease
MPHEDIPTRQRANAKRLRREMTEAERKLWRALKAHRFMEFGFRRQVPMGRYIADFICHRAKLILELDGGQHGRDALAGKDQVRDAWLQSRGYRVLRFWNAEVLKNLDLVLARIAQELPPSQPSPARGEGAPADVGRDRKGAPRSAAGARKGNGR